MQHQNEQWIQSASGFWIPKQQGSPKKQQSSQHVQLDPASLRDWKAYWKTRGQAWRREPEIDQERQQFLSKRLESKLDSQRDFYPFDISPFKDIILTRADIEWLVEERKELDLREALLNGVDLSYLLLEGASFRFAKLEGARFGGSKLAGADFYGAKLEEANFWKAEAQLKRVNFDHAELERAELGYAELPGANFWGAKLERADFHGAKLEEAIFREAYLERASFWDANLEGADFNRAHLAWAFFQQAKLAGAEFGYAELEGADFKRARLERCDFEEATLSNGQDVSLVVADALGWETIYLAAMRWPQLHVLGDEVEANKEGVAQGGYKKDKETRFKEYNAATRAYRQLGTALEGQGLKEEAERFAYRAQVMQRKVWWWSLWQQREEDQTWRRFLGERMNSLGAYLFSSLLALLTGYGYRFRRSLVSYLCVLVVFALLYWHISQGTKQPLEGIDALILSSSDMVGRGFFRQDIPTYLNDPYAGWSVLEGMIGVFMDVLLISTLTQRLFKK